MWIKKLEIEYVEVNDEPKHKEVYSNKYVRIYQAILKPGETTQFHRHQLDTMYLVISGGSIRTENSSKFKRYPIHFPKPIGIIQMVKMLWGKWILGSIYMPDGFVFFLTHKKNPCIHRAIASDTNRKDMVLMGFEMK